MSPVFGTVPIEVRAVRDLSVLAPKFRAALERGIARLMAMGFDPVVVETLRTHDRQEYLYGFGRDYDDGRGRVTFSRDADETWHGYGLAADVIPRKDGYAAPRWVWDTYGRAWQAEGLRWGADWDHDGSTTNETFLDFPHVQWGPPMRRSPSPRAARLLATGGPPAVWREVGAI